MQLIEHYEATGTVGSILFSDIPDTYTDLVVKFSLRGTFSGTSINIGFRFNGDTGSNYQMRTLGGDGSNPFTDSTTSNFLRFNYGNAATSTASTFGNGEIYIPNYQSSVAKSVSGDSVTENNATSAIQAIMAGLWTGTVPITSVSLAPVSGSWVQYSSATLYGITAGSDGIVAVS
jgi:hypothetical protein